MRSNGAPACKWIHIMQSPHQRSARRYLREDPRQIEAFADPMEVHNGSLVFKGKWIGEPEPWV